MLDVRMRMRSLLLTAGALSSSGSPEERSRFLVSDR